MAALASVAADSIVVLKKKPTEPPDGGEDEPAGGESASGNPKNKALSESMDVTKARHVDKFTHNKNTHVSPRV